VSEMTGDLLDLLGDTRGRLVQALRDGPRGVADLAEELGISEVAVRRHLHGLVDDELAVAETVRRSGPGRPAARYRLSERGRRLLPDRSAEVASDLVRYLTAVHGQHELAQFLGWRRARQQDRYEAELGEAATWQERVEKLAELLTADGFPSAVEEVTDELGRPRLALRQRHCAIRDVARTAPAVCSHEAAMFRDLLGVEVSREKTIAAGADACVCYFDPAEPADRHPAEPAARDPAEPADRDPAEPDPADPAAAGAPARDPAQPHDTAGDPPSSAALPDPAPQQR